MIDYKSYKGYMDPTADKSELLDSRGATKTETLFIETISSNSRDKYEPLYTLRECEKDGKPSAYQIFINSTDEREAALKLVGSMRHWRRLCRLKWFMEGNESIGFEGLEQWREDLRMRDHTLARAKLIRATEAGDISAAKKLFDETKEKTRGKPGPKPKKKEPSLIDELHANVKKLKDQ